MIIILTALVILICMMFYLLFKYIKRCERHNKELNEISEYVDNIKLKCGTYDIDDVVDVLKKDNVEINFELNK